MRVSDHRQRTHIRPPGSIGRTRQCGGPESNRGTSMKVMLLNDTASVPHIGCQAFSDAHARMIGAAGHIVSTRYFLGELKRRANADEDAAIQSVMRDEPLRAEIEACDVVVVNGERTLHYCVGTEYFSLPRPRRPRHVASQARKQEPRHCRTLTAPAACRHAHARGWREYLKATGLCVLRRQIESPTRHG